MNAKELIGVAMRDTVAMDKPMTKRGAEICAEAIARALANSIDAAGGPSGNLDEQLTAMLDAWKAMRSASDVLPGCHDMAAAMVTDDAPRPDQMVTVRNLFRPAFAQIMKQANDAEARAQKAEQELAQRLAERHTRPGTPESLAHGSKVEPTGESAGKRQERGGDSVRGLYEDWRPSEGRLAKVIEDAMDETGNDPRTMARALDQYLSEREQDWLEQCQAAIAKSDLPSLNELRKEASEFATAGEFVDAFRRDAYIAGARKYIVLAKDAERREGETALQLAAALAHIRNLETRFTGAIVPRKKPEKIEPGQRWAHVFTVYAMNGSACNTNVGSFDAYALEVMDSFVYIGQVNNDLGKGNAQ